MHNFNRNPISIDDNFVSVGKGLHSDQRTFLNAEKRQLKNAFLQYDACAVTNPVSLERLQPIWSDTTTDTEAQKKAKKEKRDRSFKLYGSNRPFVNEHWEGLKRVNDGTLLLCPICGLKPCTEMDHYMPRSLFHEYSSHASNLIPLCHDCNQDKHDYWLNRKGERYFFNAFFDHLPTKIIDCAISVSHGFPQAEVSVYTGLDAARYYDAVVLRTIKKLKLIDRFQATADAVMRSEIQRLKTDFLVQTTVYHGDRKAFGITRTKSYNDYVKHPEYFNFIEVEIYQALSVSEEMKNWVECSAEFLK